MIKKKTTKADLDSRKINFFLLGCAVALTLSLLALDIWASAKEKEAASQVIQAEPDAQEMEMPNTDKTPPPPPPPPEEEPMKEEVIETVFKETEKEVLTDLNFDTEVDDETAFGEMEDDNIEVVEDNEEDEIIIRIPQEKAEFPGGMTALRKYLMENTQYPPAARENGFQGVVMLEFVVEKDGSIRQVTVLNGVCKDLDEEAIRVVKSMPKWKAGKNNGQTCRSFFNLPITFSLQ